MNVLLRNIRFTRFCTQRITPIRNGSSCETQSSGVRTLVIESLEQRALIRAKGEEVVSFLQGLTTNDMAKLESPTNAAVYTMFLNKAGRVLYDAIMYRTSEPSTILIECDKDVSNDLKRHLKLYRVRRKIEIDDVGVDEFKVWSMFDPSGKHIDMAKLASMNDVKTMPDPRLRDLGCRLLASSDKTHSDLSKLCTDVQVMVELSSECCNYRDHRYGLGVAEGVQDLQPGKQFPLEANCDLLNGVSFNKGCYIGQELTARVHHTGVIRKRHMPIVLNSPLPANSTKDVRTQDGAKVGTVLGNTTDKALGLLRVEQVLKANELFIEGQRCHTKKPIWWPSEALSNVSRREGI